MIYNRSSSVPYVMYDMCSLQKTIKKCLQKYSVPFSSLPCFSMFCFSRPQCWRQRLSSFRMYTIYAGMPAVTITRNRPFFQPGSWVFVRVKSLLLTIILLFIRKKLFIGQQLIFRDVSLVNTLTHTDLHHPDPSQTWSHPDLTPPSKSTPGI